jgi:hypothetical protein
MPSAAAESPRNPVDQIKNVRRLAARRQIAIGERVQDCRARREPVCPAFDVGKSKELERPHVIAGQRRDFARGHVVRAPFEPGGFGRIGEELFACGIKSAADDYRYATRAGTTVSMEACILPNDIAAKCRELTSSRQNPEIPEVTVPLLL